MTNIRELTEGIYNAIERQGKRFDFGSGKYDQGKVNYSVDIADNGDQLTLFLKHDKSNAWNHSLWVVNYRHYGQKPTTEQWAMKLEVRDQMRALKELGNTHIRELNAEFGKNVERLASPTPAEVDAARAKVLDMDSRTADAPDDDPAYQTPAFQELPAEAQEAIRALDNQIFDLDSNAPDFHGKLEALVAQKQEVLRPYRKLTAPAPKDVRITDAQASALTMLLIEGSGLWFVKHGKQAVVNTGKGSVPVHLKVAKTLTRHKWVSNAGSSSSIYHITDAGRSALAQYNAKKGDEQS